MSTLYLLWDESQIWGLLAWRALQGFGLPHRLVRGEAIAQGLLSRKPPAALVVPGGPARRKAEVLGPRGMAAVQEYVARGGVYVGFCGGSGLGLTSEHGLDLCPWTRAAFADRMQHFVSGHIHVQVPKGHPLVPDDLPEQPLVPVWWPAQFAANEAPGVHALATYGEPGPDFWVADLPLSTVPEGTFAEWRDMYGIRLGTSFMQGHACMVHGEYGKGQYLLSYAHLETPQSPEANLWLASMLEILTGIKAQTGILPSWDLDGLEPQWEDPALDRAQAVLDDIVRLGTDHFLLFKRNPWLFGWRAGIPGANINNLYSLLVEARSTPPTDAALEWWKTRRGEFGRVLELFHEGVRGYLLAERLAMTLAKTFPEAVSQDGLKEQRAALFGPPMRQGGLYQQLLAPLDELNWALLAGRQFS